MSELQRAFAKAKLAEFPAIAPVYDENDETEYADATSADLTLDDDSSSASSASSTGTIIPSTSQNLFARPQGFAYPLLLLIYF